MREKSPDSHYHYGKHTVNIHTSDSLRITLLDMCKSIRALDF